MQDTWMNQQLDTPEKAAAFRAAFQADVYAQSSALTQNDARAAALTDRVFALMEQRFAQRVLPLNCLSYLKGQTVLLHTQMDQASHPAPAYAPVPKDPAPRTFRVHHLRKSAPAAEIIPTAEVPPELNVTAVVEDQPANAPLPIVEAVTREETIFDEDKTALWMPGESFDLEKHTQAQEAFRAQPKDTTNKRSTKLTIFNTFLFLCVIAALILLASELHLLPRLF